MAESVSQDQRFVEEQTGVDNWTKTKAHLSDIKIITENEVFQQEEKAADFRVDNFRLSNLNPNMLDKLLLTLQFHYCNSLQKQPSCMLSLNNRKHTPYSMHYSTAVAVLLENSVASVIKPTDPITQAMLRNFWPKNKNSI